LLSVIKIHFERWLFLQKIIAYQCRKDVIEEVCLTSVFVVLYLKNMLQLVNDGLTDSPFSEQDGLHYKVDSLRLHVSFQLSDKMNASEEKLREQLFADILFISK